MSRPKLILASASPRRQELLQQIGVNFTVASQDIDEIRRADESPRDFVERMAREKAASAIASLVSDEDTVVIAADTIVICEDKVLGKPRDETDALNMLALLSDNSHSVFSAVCVANNSTSAETLSESTVEFRAIEKDEAKSYWNTGEPVGKAGSYGIQGLAAVFVKSLNGSYSGVMGLPLYETACLLGKFGIDSWQSPVE